MSHSPFFPHFLTHNSPCHILQHALYEALEHEVESLYRSDTSGRRDFVKVSWDGKAPEDPKDPDAVMEWLDERGVINRVSGGLHITVGAQHY